MLVHLDLFSGIGGFALACQWAGIETIGFVEIDKYCQKVLRKHWPNVPIVEDIRDVDRIKKLAIGNSAILATGGFPCQPFSVAGKREGKADDRYLWPEMCCVIEEIRPRWLLGENVTGIIRMELDTCISDLERIGYTTQTFIIPACSVGAPHRRERIWLLAHNTSTRDRAQREKQDSMGDRPKYSGQDDANPKRERLEGADTEGDSCAPRQSMQSDTHPEGNGIQGWRPISDTADSRDWWAVEPKLGRVAHGIPHRVDRLKCLGNAIVPQVAYEIIKAIVEIDERIPQ